MKRTYDICIVNILSFSWKVVSFVDVTLSEACGV